MSKSLKIKDRFRGFLPVVVDVETGGFEPKEHALLEVAATFTGFDATEQLTSIATHHYHIAPFEGAKLDDEAMAFNQIKIDHPFRLAVTEHEALSDLFEKTNLMLKETGCNRAVLVGHNAWFDLHFLKAAAQRCKLDFPFHGFTSFDTATLSALVFGQTVLARALAKAHIPFDQNEAHSALYDCEKTAELFCYLVNQQHFPKV